MKTFTYKQAIEVLEQNFKGYEILKVWNTPYLLDIIFKDGQGRERELYTSGERCFQYRGHEFVII